MIFASLNDRARSLTRGKTTGSEWVHADSKGKPGAPEKCASRGRAESHAIGVGEIMSRNSRSCRPEDTLSAAAAAMRAGGCRFLPVVDGTGHPIGVVTDGDICLVGSTNRRTLSDLSVREAMSSPPATCRASDGLLDALRIMRGRRIRHLPVIGAHGILEGVLSLTDLTFYALGQGSLLLSEELAATLREFVQTPRTQGVIEHDPSIED